jgi:hypothetical protein
MAQLEPSRIMMGNSQNEFPGTFPERPEGFEDLTCPVAQHLFLWLTSNSKENFLIRADHPISGITSELFRNHFNFNQARTLLEYADLRHPINMKFLDWIALNGGGELVLKQKYNQEKTFALARDLAVEALEIYRQHEIYLEKPKPACNLELFLKF